ncbi:MAG: YadA-like family protein [Veillonella sp.]|nr:YadA-like family protein [Veillonella sp.]
MKDTDGRPIKREVATMDDGLRFTGNNTDTENKHALNTLVKVQGEGVTAAQSTAFQSAAGNINVVADGTDTLTVKLNKDLKGINSIKNSDNGPALNFNAGDLSVTGGNLNMGGNKITNLGKGTNDTDAVNLKQLKDSRTIVKSTDGTVGVQESETTDGAKVYDLSTGASPRFDELTDEIGRTGAQGAALAALKPIQYDPLEPTQIMAGYGNYRGNSAIAMGVAHYKNESTMMHAGLAWAGGSRHMMANAGVTWKVGNRDSEAAVADRYRKGPISSAYAMQQEMASVKAQNAGLKTEVSDLKAENEQMKAQIAAMMAKLGM